jgi:dipeptidyl aminopeptidase/acylaminoacyl peptidase
VHPAYPKQSDLHTQTGLYLIGSMERNCSRLLFICVAAFILQFSPAHAQQSFGPDDVLKMTPVIETVAGQPNGNAAAMIVAQIGDALRIRPYQQSGILNLGAPGGETVKFESDPNAYFATWSPDGTKVAFFSGFGADRKLVVISYPTKNVAVVREPIQGEYQRQPALFFRPIWLRDSRSIIVAAAEFHNVKIPSDKPYSVSSATKNLDSDFDFRDDTLWRLVQIDATTGKRQVLTDPMAIRTFEGSPTQDLIFLSEEEKSNPGHFEGDTYVRKASYFFFTPGGGLKLVDLDSFTSAGWDLSGNFRFERNNQLMQYEKQTGSATVYFSQNLIAHAHYQTAGRLIAYWGNNQELLNDDYLNPPPSASRLVVHTPRIEAKTLISESENKEIVEALWLSETGPLAIHVRDLSSFDEEVRLFYPDSGESRTVVSGQSSIQTMSVANSGRSLIVQAQTALGRDKILSIASDTGAITKLHEIDDSQGHPTFVMPRILTFNDKNGHLRHALLFVPKSHKPGDPTPLVSTAYGRLTNGANTFQAEAQMHIAKGYAYLMPDVFVYRRHMDKAFIETIPAAIEAARRDSGLSGPVGFYGGSLGGFAGLTLLAKTNVLNAAALRAAPSEFSLSWATGKDRDADLLEYLMSGKTPYTDKALYDDNSPFWFAPQIHEPLLLLQGDLDMQVPIAQGQWMFQSLRRLGKTVEFRTYPGGDHGITRANHDYYVDFYDQIFRWWSLYLKPEKVKVQ